MLGRIFAALLLLTAGLACLVMLCALIMFIIMLYRMIKGGGENARKAKEDKHG